MDKEKNLRGTPVYYGSAKLCGFEQWTPEAMRRILESYGGFVSRGDYDSAFKAEKKENLPETWLNWILSSNNLSRETINSQTIKGGEAKR